MSLTTYLWIQLPLQVMLWGAIAYNISICYKQKKLFKEMDKLFKEMIDNYNEMYPNKPKKDE